MQGMRQKVAMAEGCKGHIGFPAIRINIGIPCPVFAHRTSVRMRLVRLWPKALPQATLAHREL